MFSGLSHFFLHLCRQTLFRFQGCCPTYLDGAVMWMLGSEVGTLKRDELGIYPGAGSASGTIIVPYPLANAEEYEKTGACLKDGQIHSEFSVIECSQRTFFPCQNIGNLQSGVEGRICIVSEGSFYFLTYSAYYVVHNKYTQFYLPL